jgi:hypothetical protein
MKTAQAWLSFDPEDVIEGMWGVEIGQADHTGSPVKRWRYTTLQ